MSCEMLQYINRLHSLISENWRRVYASAVRADANSFKSTVLRPSIFLLFLLEKYSSSKSTTDSVAVVTV